MFVVVVFWCCNCYLSFVVAVVVCCLFFVVVTVCTMAHVLFAFWYYRYWRSIREDADMLPQCVHRVQIAKTFCERI